jgi:hypothetical protein
MPTLPEIRPALIRPPLNVPPVMAIAVFVERTSLAASIAMPALRARMVPRSMIAPTIVLSAEECRCAPRSCRY